MTEKQMLIALAIILSISIIAVVRATVQTLAYRSACLHKDEKAGQYCILCEKADKCVKNQNNEAYRLYKRIEKLSPAEAETLKNKVRAELNGKA